jgi:formylmethanofuran dehydrogenase subunit E
MNHVHKYVRVKKSAKATKTFFKCAIPACVHKVEKAFAIGRLSICNRCGNEFILDTRALDLAKPHCSDCTKSSKNEMVIDLASKLEGLLK